MKRLLLAAFLFTAGASFLLAQESGKSEESGDKWLPWKTANFVILAVGLGYLMGKSLPPFFKSRTSDIQKGISEAQKMKQEAEKRAADMDARMSALGAEIEQFRKQAATEMEAEGGRIREDTSKQIAKLQQQAEQEIESAGKNARRELKTYAAELAMQLAEQRIKTRLDAPTENGLVEGFIQDLQRQGSKN